MSTMAKQAILLLTFLLAGCASSLPDAQVSTSATAPAVAELQPSTVRTADAAAEKPVLATRPRQACNREHAVSPGMTAAQVYASCLGKPTDINSTTTGKNKFDLFVYQGTDYVYLEDGVVKSVQISSR
jgi:hypothetical protein